VKIIRVNATLRLECAEMEVLIISKNFRPVISAATTKMALLNYLHEYSSKFSLQWKNTCY
jgi:hypothetical protein